MYHSRNLHAYFQGTAPSQPLPCADVVVEIAESHIEHSDSSLKTAIEKLKSIVRMTSNQRYEKQTPNTKFEFVRHLAVLRFLEAVLEKPRSRIRASTEIAKQIFSGGASRARSIRNWSDEYVRTQKMMLLRQGKHQKTESIIDDADIRFPCLVIYEASGQNL